ncbi:hypothetical protein O181_056533 [Austropuccinia psidii MF-1]|uniref:Uncharacterized protein n=1 Tax=Austropuccinia psidii MF-1 TaxID=1389203 RepID=A0A9Q3HTJ0_9BASI|nr:hypothetical protein [Austropuccinia psidii MF-1]
MSGVKSPVHQPIFKGRVLKTQVCTSWGHSRPFKNTNHLALQVLVISNPAVFLKGNIGQGFFKGKLKRLLFQDQLSRHQELPHCLDSSNHPYRMYSSHLYGIDPFGAQAVLTPTPRAHLDGTPSVPQLRAHLDRGTNMEVEAPSRKEGRGSISSNSFSKVVGAFPVISRTTLKVLGENDEEEEDNSVEEYEYNGI